MTPVGTPEVASAVAPDPRSAESHAPCALDVVTTLVTRLDAAGVRYCQFKSNWHLEQGLQGLTDLDVLVDPGAGASLTSILEQSGYKKFSAPPGGDYPGVEDYLAMDTTTGRLVHLHLHHQLTTGEPHLKGYRFPWEELMLSTRRRDERTGFFVSDPAAELLFLLVRNTLKIGVLDRIRASWGQDAVRDRLTSEVLWLRGRTRVDRTVELGRSLLGEASAPALREILEAGPSLGRMLALRARALPVLRRYRLYAPAAAWLLRRRRELQSFHTRVGSRIPALAGAISRTDPRGGVLIAFMGPDGAGKSRLAGEIAAWLRWKLDARVSYFGSGDGPSSLARWPLKLGLRVAQALGLWTPGRAGAARSQRGDPADRSGAGSREPSPARALWALLLALEKRGSLRRAWRARDRGIVVICDRYPQNQVMGFNDGPLLHRWSRSRWGLLRALARWESAPYRWAEEHPPRLVVKLHVSPRVAVDRKPEMRAEEIERRIEALVSLRYPAMTSVVDLDADRRWEDVLLDCKTRVWEVL